MVQLKESRSSSCLILHGKMLLTKTTIAISFKQLTQLFYRFFVTQWVRNLASAISKMGLMLLWSGMESTMLLLIINLAALLIRVMAVLL